MERIKKAFLSPSFCSGFTNTSHVNEAGSISVVPGAWIVFKKKKGGDRERQRDNVLLIQSSLAAATENCTYLHYTCFSFLRLHATVVSAWIKGLFQLATSIKHLK